MAHSKKNLKGLLRKQALQGKKTLEGSRPFAKKPALKSSIRICLKKKNWSHLI
jgi:hypothetical protein